MTHETPSTCPYCGVGCGVLIAHDGERITGVRGDPAHPANFGRLCSKGSTLHLTASPAVIQHARLLQPMQRLQRGQAPQARGWDEAADTIATQLATLVTEHGPDAVGLYVSGQLLTEDYYVFNKLAKGLLGTNNIDTNSRLCMSSAVAGYKQTLGADAPPACYDDFNHAATVFVTGANPAWAHPILFRRLEDARRANPAQKLVVVDPRRTETAQMADLHLALNPGSDVALHHGLLHLMIREGWIDEAWIAAHTTGFDALRERVRAWTPERTAATTGLAMADIETAARWFATGGPALSLYCQGLNQSSQGTANNATLVHLHLATGQIGKPGAGPFSLTGQPNAMGGREVGGLANLLSAHRDLANPAHRAEVAALWGVDEVPATPGKTAVDMFRAAADGQIKALWIVCTNPAHSLPDQAMVRAAMERAELVIVQDAFATTATGRLADWLLPATTWGEKDGTVTNSERRISRVRPAVPAPGESRHDWAIAVDIARRLEARLRPGRPSLFDYPTPESVWVEHRESTRGRDLDITGLSYARIERDGPQQWPLPEGAATGRARLYADGRFPTADGRARFVDVEARELAEPVDTEYPHALNTGRLRDQWHGMSRTGTLGRLFGHQPEPTLDLPPQTMQDLTLAEGTLVEVRSRRGRLVLPARADAGLQRGHAHIAMHWGDEMVGGSDGPGRAQTGVNALTVPAYCPTSKQPELKHAAISLQPADLPWQLSAAVWLDEAGALALRRTLGEQLDRWGYASVVPFGHDGHGVLLRAAAAQAPSAETIDALQALFGLDGAAGPLLRYDDAGAGERRVVALQEAAASGSAPAQTPDPAAAAASAGPAGQPEATGRRLRGYLLAGDARSQAWLQPLLLQRTAVDALGNRLLMACAEAPIALADRGKQICTCFDVTEPEIRGCLSQCAGSDEQRLATLQQSLRCGTNCGSCLPTLKRLVQAVAVPVVVVAAPTGAASAALPA
ncbi:MAG: hypothetical protein RLY78_629 [Pseudomonadota bacterium]